ncbi:MAG: TonB-dependent receptor [Flavobacteriales bacterium]
MMLLRPFAIVPLILLGVCSSAQTTAILAGRVTDAASSLGLAQASVEVVIGDTSFTAISDSLGYFRLDGLPTGIVAVSGSMPGYGSAVENDVWLRSGKPEHVDLRLPREGKVLPEATVHRTVTVYPAAGAYDLTVEKSLRYPATFFDPARLASAYPGVSATNDQANHFSVRGNSPNANAWLLEGVEIVSPNHTGNAGTPSDQPTFSGGGTTMLSAQMLGNSHLYTGSVPVQFGNALGGVMDMRLRRGANDRPRFTAQAGLIGIDLSTEGPFAKGGKASYLINYRYSTLGLLGAMGVALGDEAITFQDLAFNVATPIGRRAWLNVFGMGGMSSNRFDAKEETEREFDKDERNIDYESNMGAAGLSSTVALGERAQWRTTVAWSEGEQERLEEMAQLSTGVVVRVDQTRLRERKVSGYTEVQGALGSLLTYTIGGSAMEHTVDRIGFSFRQENTAWLFRPFADLRVAVSERVSVSTGAAWSHFTFNGSSVLQPSIGVQCVVLRKAVVSLTAESRAQLPQMQLYSTGTAEAPVNHDIGLSRSSELVAALSLPLGSGATLLHIETFYQQLTDIPIADTRLVDDAGIGTYSMVNAWDEATFINLVDSGDARNVGVELALARRMQRNWFYQVNTTIYDATYVDANGVERNARWNGQYIANLVLGREWAKQREGSKRTWGASIRANTMGGQYATPIDVELSRDAHTTVYDLSQAYTDQLGSIFRMDVRVYLKREHRNRTGMWALDLLNATNAQNEAFKYFDVRKDEVVTKYQLGLIPNLSYRIEF